MPLPFALTFLPRCLRQAPTVCWAFALLSMGTLLSCQKTPKVVVPIESLAASETPMAFWVTELGLTGEKTDGYFKALTRRAGGQALERVHQSLIVQLGFDPLMPESMQKAGLRPGGGAMVWMEPGLPQPLLALPCADAKTLDATLQAIVSRRDGAKDVSRTSAQGDDIITVARPFGQGTVPSAHWAHIAGYTVLTQGDGLSALTAFLQRHRSDARAQAGASLIAPVRALDLQALPKGVAYLALQGPVRPDAQGAQLGPQTPSSGAIQHAMTASWRWDAQGFAADIRMHDAHLTHAKLDAMFGGLPTGPLAGLVNEDAWALGLTRYAQLEGATGRLHDALARLEQMGVPHETSELLLALQEAFAASLAGPLAVSLHPRAELSAAHLMSQIQKPRGLGQMLQLAAVADIKDETQAAKKLAALPQIFADQNVVITSSKQDIKGQKLLVYSTQSQGAQMSWALLGKRLVWGLGEHRLQQSIETLLKGPSALGQAAPDSVLGLWRKSPGSVLALRCGAIAHSIEQMTQDPNQSGSAASAAGLGAVISGVADVLRTLGDVGIGLSDDSVPGPDAQTTLGAPMRLVIRQRMQ